MYVIEVRPGGSAILQDMKARELKEARAKFGPDGWEFYPVSAVRAHRWVKAGEIHGTDLWIDDTGRVRRAGIGC